MTLSSEYNVWHGKQWLFGKLCTIWLSGSTVTFLLTHPLELGIKKHRHARIVAFRKRIAKLIDNIFVALFIASLTPVTIKLGEHESYAGNRRNNAN